MAARYVRCDYLRVGDRIMTNNMSAVIIGLIRQPEENRVYFTIRYDDDAGVQLIKTSNDAQVLLVAEVGT